jgi:tetratricopeptide (TPR) repeat protein
MLTKVFPLFVLGILSTGILAGQCPGDDSLQKRIALISSATVLVREKLKTLLELEQKSKQCNQWQDTTKALLLQKIASAYFNEADYIQAIHYIQQSIDLTTVAARNSLSQSGFLIKSYYDLSRMYDSVRNVRKRLAALDSCAAVADRINEVSTYHLYALHARVQHFFDVGEYNRCISYAERCEKLGRQYAATHPDDIYNTGMWYAFNSLGWIVNSLLQMNDYNAAEKLLVNKINECKKIGLQNYYGTLYGQLAEVKERSGNYNEALSLYNKSLMYEQQWGASYNCKVVLNNIAYLYGNQLNDTKKALFFYKKALHFDDANKQLSGMDSLELLNIAANIGRNYSRQNEFDSAFYYFQRAFNYIKYGMTETDVLSSSLDEFVRQKKVGYLSGLLISKADAYLEKYKVSRRKIDIEAAIRAYPS